MALSLLSTTVMAAQPRRYVTLADFGGFGGHGRFDMATTITYEVVPAADGSFRLRNSQSGVEGQIDADGNTRTIDISALMKSYQKASLTNQLKRGSMPFSVFDYLSRHIGEFEPRQVCMAFEWVLLTGDQASAMFEGKVPVYRLLRLPGNAPSIKVIGSPDDKNYTLITMDTKGIPEVAVLASSMGMVRGQDFDPVTGKSEVLPMAWQKPQAASVGNLDRRRMPLVADVIRLDQEGGKILGTEDNPNYRVLPGNYRIPQALLVEMMHAEAEAHGVDPKEYYVFGAPMNRPTARAYISSFGGQPFTPQVKEALDSGKPSPGDDLTPLPGTTDYILYTTLDSFGSKWRLEDHSVLVDDLVHKYGPMMTDAAAARKNIHSLLKLRKEVGSFDLDVEGSKTPIRIIERSPRTYAIIADRACEMGLSEVEAVRLAKEIGNFDEHFVEFLHSNYTDNKIVGSSGESNGRFTARGSNVVESRDQKSESKIDGSGQSRESFRTKDADRHKDGGIFVSNLSEDEKDPDYLKRVLSGLYKYYKEHVDSLSPRAKRFMIDNANDIRANSKGVPRAHLPDSKNPLMIEHLGFDYLLESVPVIVAAIGPEAQKQVNSLEAILFEGKGMGRLAVSHEFGAGHSFSAHVGIAQVPGVIAELLPGHLKQIATSVSERPCNLGAFMKDLSKRRGPKY
jgi:hypothetical protein